MSSSTSVISQAFLDAPKIELCPDCGREWPARFGSHNCNHRRAHIHKNAIVIEPGADLLESVQRLTSRMEGEVCKSAEYANLGGDESPYPAALSKIDAAIGHLKRFRQEIQTMRGHTHDWSEETNDYCTICGADGRA
jgi:hypothetical protein